MAAVVNDRDVLIMAAKPRYAAATNSGMFVSPASSVIKTASDGSSPSPASLSFQATLLNLAGTVTWTWSSGLAPVANGNSITLDAAKVTAAASTITATIVVDGVTYTQIVTVTKVADGAAGVGTPGARGAGHFYVAGSSWSNTVASAACPGGPIENDVVTISDGTSFVNEMIYRSGAWAQQGVVINGGLIVPGTVTTNQINANGLVLRDKSGKALIGLGTALDDSLVPGSTRNSNVSIGSNGALTGAGGGQVTIGGLGYSGDLNATRGAPAGTTVGGTAAETVASNAASGANAAAAIPGINSSLADKLSKSVASALQTQITLSTSGAIQVGNASYSSAGFGGTGVVMTPYGIAGVAGGVPKFYIGTDGNPYFAGTLGAGIVKASQLNIGSPDNIVPDIKFNDLNWWGRVGNTVATWADAGYVTAWAGGASLFLSQNAGESISYSSPFVLTPGATYLVQCQVSLNNDFNGRFSIYWTIPGVIDYNMTGQVAGTNWSDGLQVHLTNNSPKGIVNFATLYTVPASGSLSKGVIQIRNSHTAGTVEVGSISITRVADSTLIGPGSVQTKHLSISQGGDISSGQTGYNNGLGFWIEGAGAGHGPRMSLGNSAGKSFLCDPSNDILGLYGATVTNITIADSFSASLGGSAGGSYPNGSRGYGTLTASPIGGRAPYTYSWSLSPYGNSGNAGNMTITNPAAQSVSFGGSGTNATLDYRVTCVVTDANGRTATLNTEVVANHGTPP